MSIDKFFTTAVTILEPGSADDGYNGTAPDWTAATSTSAYGWLTQVGTSEQIGGRDVTVSGWQLFLPTGTAISSTARVVANGITYEVDGVPDVSPQTARGAHHIEVRLRVAAEVVV